MQKWIVYNWLALAILALLVAGYIAVFEHFLKDKGYLYIVLALIFGLLFYRKRHLLR